MNFRQLLNDADKAGKAAAEACKPTPMVVAQHASPLDDKSPVVKMYQVSGGVCGFAWVVIKPANSKLANYMKKNGIGRSNYGGGWCLWVQDYNQSMELKMAYAEAYAKVLRDAGFKAYSDSRMD